VTGEEIFELHRGSEIIARNFTFFLLLVLISLKFTTDFWANFTDAQNNPKI
jgi:fumarate reductase subunit C